MGMEMCHVILKISVIVLYCHLSFVNCDILYTKDDSIVLVDKNNFQSEIFNKENAWIIEFYNSWCGTCIRFAPTWKQLAKKVEDWSSVIGVAALDCSEEENVKICNTHIGNEGYPTIKFYPPQFTQEMIHQTKIYKGEHDLLKVQAGMVDFVESCGDKFVNNDVALSFTPLKALEDIWNEVTDNTKHTVVIFEDEKSYLGRMTILDVVKYKSVLIRRVLKDKANKYGVTVYPSMYLIDKGGTFKELASGLKQNIYKDVLCDMIGVDLNTDNSIEGAGESPDEQKQSEAHEHQSTTVIHMLDLESTLQYSLRREIASYGKIEGPAMTALTNYIYVLAKYLPGRPSIMQYLWSVYKWLQKQQGTLSGNMWLTDTKSLETPIAKLPGYIKWACCQGSAPRFRGYPCGVWSMFHVLTVNSAELKKKYSDYHAKEVLYAMKGYITTFVGCKECGANFKKEVIDLDKNVTSSDTQILYLWRVHNKVNKRLHGDVTEDPQHIKVQFPTRQMCSTCHTSKGGSNETTWNEKEVLKFLKQVYSLQNIIQDTGSNNSNLHITADEGVSDKKAFFNPKDPKLRKDFESFARQKQLRKENSNADALTWGNIDVQRQMAKSKMAMLEKDAIYEYRRNSILQPRSWGFTNLDISMCVLFYFCCTGIILGFYFHFIVKKRMSVKRLSSIWS